MRVTEMIQRLSMAITKAWKITCRSKWSANPVKIVDSFSATSKQNDQICGFKHVQTGTAPQFRPILPHCHYHHIPSSPTPIFFAVCQHCQGIFNKHNHVTFESTRLLDHFFPEILARANVPDFYDETLALGSTDRRVSCSDVLQLIAQLTGQRPRIVDASVCLMFWFWWWPKTSRNH